MKTNEVCDINCPYFPREGVAWGGGPEFWQAAKERHERHNKKYCPHCGKELI